MPDAATPPPAEIEHRLPGRMRLRVRARRGDDGFFRQAEAALARVPGVRAVRANPATGGILIEHGSDETALLAEARERGLFEAAPPPARAEAPATLDLAALGFAGAGLLQAARGRALGSATENLFNAHSAYFTSNQPRLAAVLLAFGLLQVARGEVLGSAVSLFLYANSLRRTAEHEAVRGTV